MHIIERIAERTTRQVVSRNAAIEVMGEILPRTAAGGKDAFTV
ncbi:hypothetical protein ACT3SP_09395 [Brachybacterium sp. AOP43-C2-M15]